MVKKYIKIDGVLKPNPEHPANKAKAATTSTIVNVDISLTVITSVDDIADHNATYADDPIHMADSTMGTIDIMQDEMILDQYHPSVTDDMLLEGLSKVFAKWDAPIGLVTKLLELSTDEFCLEFLQDDSGSMTHRDATLADGTTCSRWDEAKERLIDMMKIMAFIPVKHIRIQFLNRSEKVVLTHAGKTPTNFADEAERAINDAFMNGPSGGTPILENLRPIIEEAEAREERTAVYMLFDGQPNGGQSDIEAIGKLLMGRTHEKIPFTFITCTGNDSDVEWAKGMEEKVTGDGAATFMSEMDDFESERAEVLRDQGYGVPYGRGFWLICNLASAINPSDLDMMDEEIPLTMFTLSNLLGRAITPQEFDHYWHYYMENDKRDAASKAHIQQTWGPLKDRFGVQSCAYPSYEAITMPEVIAYQVNHLSA